ncbi:glycosyltransferase family 2 protein [Aneurinibacillus sp. Ricciae_BoGa-3]|uniref:glycosyltransferase family 2 protein n=1 Tax=Aneurinibacillus sp. Ricciae_BoGa-3 TaxID=3022697 RepID=UPI00233FEDFE|nr:glycosyltransferase family 2 protein [Aneurinibacillus sp. Ricciae_BoGa-3]WCK55937.1 glycosyltransferase family 2 protein [Aneurinibacillus sp. Ricciae_BoGa-3]
MAQRSAIIIPAYNEGEYLQSTLQAVRQFDVPGTKEVIVINDGSSDDTARIAESWADAVVHLPENRGKGYALWRGIQAANADFFLFLDADLAETARYGSSLLEALYRGTTKDLVIAALPPGQKSGFGMAKKTASRAIYHLTGWKIAAPLSGQRALSRKAVQAVTDWDCGFGIEVAMTIDIARAGLTVYEVSYPFSHRERGKTIGGFLHRGRQYAAIRRVIRQKRQEGRL